MLSSPNELLLSYLVNLRLNAWLYQTLKWKISLRAWAFDITSIKALSHWIKARWKILKSRFVFPIEEGHVSAMLNCWWVDLSARYSLKVNHLKRMKATASHGQTLYGIDLPLHPRWCFFGSMHFTNPFVEVLGYMH